MRKLAVFLAMVFLASIMALPTAHAVRKGKHYHHNNYRHPKCITHPCKPEKYRICQAKCTDKYGVDGIKCADKEPRYKGPCIHKNKVCRTKCKEKFY